MFEYKQKNKIEVRDSVFYNIIYSYKVIFFF